MKNKNKLTIEQIEKIKSMIDEKLRLRCIFVTTTLEEKPDEYNRKTRLKLSSTKFNTIPVIHSPIEVVDFGTWLTESEITHTDGEIFRKVEVSIDVSAMYEGNGVTLFKFNTTLFISKSGYTSYE